MELLKKRVNFKNGMMDICLEMKKSIIRGLLLIIFRRGCVPQAYWVNTGKNEILEDVLKVADKDITEKL